MTKIEYSLFLYTVKYCALSLSFVLLVWKVSCDVVGGTLEKYVMWALLTNLFLAYIKCSLEVQGLNQTWEFVVLKQVLLLLLLNNFDDMNSDLIFAVFIFHYILMHVRG